MLVSLNHLNILRMFGRAMSQGRDNEGGAFLITEFGELPDYVSELMHQAPIESHTMGIIVDNLNAVIFLGSITNLFERVSWLFAVTSSSKWRSYLPSPASSRAPKP
jgi:replicative superfamily II helicase